MLPRSKNHLFIYNSCLSVFFTYLYLFVYYRSRFGIGQMWIGIKYNEDAGDWKWGDGSTDLVSGNNKETFTSDFVGIF